MSSGDMGLVPPQNGLNSHLVFQDDALRFNCGAPAAQRRVVGGGGGGDTGPKTRDLSGFIDERFFAPQGADFRRSMYGDPQDRRDPPEARNWNGNGAVAETPSVDGSDDDEDDDEDDVDDEEEEVDEGIVGGEDNGQGSNSNNASNVEGKMGNGKAKHQSQNQNHHSPFGVNMMVGSSRDVIVKESGIVQQTVSGNVKAGTSENHHHHHHHHHDQGRLGNYQSTVTVAEPDGGDGYYSQYFQGHEGSASGQKDLAVENGCGFSGRKDIYMNESGESLRAILSDPVMGGLMDDAMILPCGHSFGGGGIQHVIRMKACYSCSQSISEDSIAPNLALRTAVQAFRREEELQFHRSSKRKRERYDQDKGVYGDSNLMELPRGKGVQFPFAVTDRVIIKGNKRTPPRFVGREAVVTTQCLNGWYVVKTLDNAESVKLQYRSLAKVPNDHLTKPMSSKMAPNWL